MTLDPHAILETQDEMNARLRDVPHEAKSWEAARQRYVVRAMDQQKEQTKALAELAAAMRVLAKSIVDAVEMWRTPPIYVGQPGLDANILRRPGGDAIAWKKKDEE